MAKVPNGEEKLPKIPSGSVARTNVTDRQTTDRRAIAYSERKREFTFAKTQRFNYSIGIWGSTWEVGIMGILPSNLGIFTCAQAFKSCMRFQCLQL